MWCARPIRAEISGTSSAVPAFQIHIIKCPAVSDESGEFLYRTGTLISRCRELFQTDRLAEDRKPAVCLHYSLWTHLFHQFRFCSMIIYKDVLSGTSFFYFCPPTITSYSSRAVGLYGRLIYTRQSRTWLRLLAYLRSSTGTLIERLKLTVTLGNTTQVTSCWEIPTISRR